MPRFLTAIVSFLFVSNLLFAQTIPELEKRNGFKDIRLGMVIDSLKGHKFKKEIKEKDEFIAKIYSVEEQDAYAKIGEVEVNEIEVKTYKDQVYQIKVVADKDTRIMKALESLYGLAEYDHKRETYFWKSQNLILKFRSHSKSQLEMVYTSFPLLNLMKQDKRKKVQDIANDF